MRIALLIAGILGLVLGLVWIGQGTGLFPYPASSFMISEMTWAYRGVALAVIGLILIVLARRM
jgi:membrane protein implicated in regulation of membrane protease activity